MNQEAKLDKLKYIMQLMTNDSWCEYKVNQNIIVIIGQTHSHKPEKYSLKYVI